MNNKILIFFIFFFFISCTFNIHESKIYYTKSNYKDLEINSYIEFTNDDPGNRLVIDIIDTAKNQFDINEIKVKFLNMLVNYKYKSYIKANLGYIKHYNFILSDDIVSESKYYTLYINYKYRKSNDFISDSIIIIENYRVIKNDFYKQINKIFPRLGH